MKIDPGAFAFGFIAEGIKRLRQRRMRKRRLKELGMPEEADMDSLKGALKSKLVWLGVAQGLYGLFELWSSGMLTIESAGPILSGVLTVVFRAMTDKPLAAK